MQLQVMDGNKPTRNASGDSDWRLLAERARVEMDPEKLLNLVTELNRILEEQQSHPSDRESGENRESHENRSSEEHSN
jgi:hypothetical protein